MIVLIGFRDTKAEYHLAYERRIGDLRARPGKVVAEGEHEIIDASHHSGAFQQRLVAASVGVRHRGGYFYASAIAVNTVERQRNPRTGFSARGVQYVCSKPAHRPLLDRIAIVSLELNNVNKFLSFCQHCGRNMP